MERNKNNIEDFEKTANHAGSLDKKDSTQQQAQWGLLFVLGTATFFLLALLISFFIKAKLNRKHDEKEAYR